MSSTATITYTAFLGGASAASAAALMASVPPPASVLSFLGVRVVSDSTPAASPVVRTLVLGLNPVATATATAALDAGQSGSPVTAVTVTAPGSGYVAPPVVTFTGGRSQTPPNTNVNQSAYSSDAPAKASAFLKVVSAAVTAAGSGYSGATFAEVAGGLSAGGRAAVLTLTIVGGHITGVSVVDAGSGYTSVPTLTIVDPAMVPGTGGSVSVSLGVDVIKVTNGGAGFTEPPTVVLTPLFQALFPPGSDQSIPFRNLMNTALEQAVMSPVSAAAPIIA